MIRQPQAVPAMVAEPTVTQIEAYARYLHLTIPAEQMELVRTRVAESLKVFEHLAELETTPNTPRHQNRDPGRVPSKAEDPYNAIIRFCTVTGAESGPLAGWRIGVKDNIAVAGVPMTEGRAELTTMPSEDAVVVERILDAGGIITAKTSINGDDTPFGATRNPRNPD